MKTRRDPQNTVKTYIRLMSEIHYIALFGADSESLKAQLGLPPEDTFDDDNLRDHMGIEALTALSETESECAAMISAFSHWTESRLLDECRIIGERIGKRWRQKCKEQGIDFLRGKHPRKAS